MGLGATNGPFGQQYIQGAMQQITSAGVNVQLQSKAAPSNSLQPTLKGAPSIQNLVSNFLVPTAMDAHEVHFYLDYMVYFPVLC